jgi:hypothetical protein
MTRVIAQASRLAERGLGLHLLIAGGGLLAGLVANWRWDQPCIFTLAGFFAGLTGQGILQIVFPGLDPRAHSAALSGLLGLGLAIDGAVNGSGVAGSLAVLAISWAVWRGQAVMATRRTR